MIEYKPDLETRKEILSRVCGKSRDYKIKIAFAYMFVIIGIGFVVVSAIVTFIDYETQNLILLLLGIIFGCVPYFIGTGIKNKANYEYGLPYSSYANGTAIISDEEFTYEFWKVGPNESAAYSSKRAVFKDEDKFIYRISKNSIKDISCDENGICEIHGVGTIEEPSGEKFNAVGFSFAVAFTEKDFGENLLDLLQNKNCLSSEKARK